MATRPDYKEFLLFAYFGKKSLCDPLAACIERAYLDFSRTLHGIANLHDKAGTNARVEGQIKIAVNNLIDPGSGSETGFDSWHRHTCSALKGTYANAGFSEFTVGQAQKWINMTMKYIYTFGEKIIPGFLPFYPCCHAPLDTRIIEALSHYGFPKFQQSWSRLDDYDEYMNCQIWIRQTFAVPPLDLEFFAWMTPGADLSQYLRRALSAGAN